MKDSLQTSNPLLESQRAIEHAAKCGVDYLTTLAQRNVAPTSEALARLSGFDEPLPDSPSDPKRTIDYLHQRGSPATVATAAGRFFGLVVGGSLPAAAGARVLNAAWDQLATTDATSPVGVKLEQVASKWLLEILGLPKSASVGYVSGTTIGNFVCLSAARHCLLKRQAWDVEKQGLCGAPPLHIVASEEVHITVKKVLSMLGLGYQNIEYVACDENGAMRIDLLPELHSNSLVLTQAGNVNSGAIDPIGAIAEKAKEVGAWVHVDGAFGLWAAASDQKRHLLSGLDKADSWVTDGHKWLNTPYDCGMAICRHPQDIHAAMSTVAPYLEIGSEAAPKDMVPELSRTVRGVEIWAALRSLGRKGVEDLVDRCCQYARYFASELEGMGFEILNDVVLNQVVVTHPQHDSRMIELCDAVIADGETWFGPTYWQGRDAFRISVSSWVTSREDILRSLQAIKKQAVNLKII